MGKINYWEIFKRSWQIAWQYKRLWWLGLLAGSGSAASFNFPTSFQKEAEQGAWAEKIASFVDSHLTLVLGILVLVIIIFILLELLKILAFNGLVRSVAGIEKGDIKNIQEALGEGKKFFARILALRMLLAFSILATILVLALPVAFLFVAHSPVLGAITALMAFLILIPAIVSFSFIAHYGSFYIIVSDLPLVSALEQGCKIFTKNIWSGVLMSLLFIPINIAAGLLFFLPIAALGLIFALLGFISYQMFSALGAWVIGILAGILFLILLLLFRSVMSVFYNTAWFLFFRSLSSIKKEEVEIKEELLIEKVVPGKA